MSAPGGGTARPAIGPDRLRRHVGILAGQMSDLGSRKAPRRAVAAFRAHSEFPAESLAAPALIPGIAWSDHRSFRRQGYRALMVTDTAFYRYPYYHAPEDTPDRLAYEPLARVVEGLHGAVLDLASAV